VLFDIDGTLLHGRPEGHTRAMVDAMARVWSVPVAPDDVWAVDPAGRTDREIARLVLRGHGVADAAIDSGIAEWMIIASQVHERVAGDHPAPVAATDAPAVTAGLVAGGAEIALLTGNLEPIGRAKVAAAGLADRFGPGGGFGSDAERRSDLVGVAMSRARRSHAHGDVVIVGDTPRDIAAAREAGVRVVAVTTGAFAAQDLSEADGVADGLTGAVALIMA